MIEARAPMVGSFNRAPSPEAPPFVESGTAVAEGDPLCLIEAVRVCLRSARPPGSWSGTPSRPTPPAAPGTPPTARRRRLISSTIPATVTTPNMPRS